MGVRKRLTVVTVILVLTLLMLNLKVTNVSNNSHRTNSQDQRHTQLSSEFVKYSTGQITLEPQLQKDEVRRIPHFLLPESTKVGGTLQGSVPKLDNFGKASKVKIDIIKPTGYWDVDAEVRAALIGSVPKIENFASDFEDEINYKPTGYGNIDYVTLAEQLIGNKELVIHSRESKVNVHKPRNLATVEPKILADRFDSLISSYDGPTKKKSNTEVNNIKDVETNDMRIHKNRRNIKHTTTKLMHKEPKNNSAKPPNTKLSSLMNIIAKNSLIKDYVKKFKEGYDELFYTIDPISIGVPEVEERKEETEISNSGIFDVRKVKAAVAFTLPGCNCSREPPATRQQQAYSTLKRISNNRVLIRRVAGVSTCSDEATARGPGQRVVSYSYFGKTSDPGVYERYFSEIPNRAKEIQQHYPGMLMRVYHNVGPEDRRGLEEMCRAFCLFPHLDFCNVSALPTPWLDFGSIKKVGTLWRFLTLMDPLVDLTLVRDLDSYLLRREVDAVNEWLESDIPYHVMRDHPLHNTHILAGLWDAHTSLDRAEAYHFTALMLSQPYNDLWDYDQRLLRRVLWPAIKHKTMTHDSYTCGLTELQGSHSPRPFPTQREGRNYTGFGKTKLEPSKLLTACPIACRPQSHKEWTMC